MVLKKVDQFNRGLQHFRILDSNRNVAEDLMIILCIARLKVIVKWHAQSFMNFKCLFCLNNQSVNRNFLHNFLHVESLR